ncbi:AMP-dependent synthetase [Sorangium cellulosum]|uniref:AMP-dependent synthetase n=1 Tax=Sorangium cellulosum TaxID=56 RepID=A0A2L0F8P0_SORCE|nr:AMP-binding protein [Sorangium cellulosum]AUX47954.1 AMP-dependent synthetase [Sorangium cellulosum]
MSQLGVTNGAGAKGVELTPPGGARGDELAAVPPLVPSHVFSGKQLVVVGGTGFLGKVWLAMLLTRFPEIAHIYLLVRAKENQSPEERFWSQIATSPVFDPLREQHPGPAFEEYLRQKVTPMNGNVGQPLLGLGDRVGELTGKIAAVVNVAGVVDFNPPLDEALEVNAFGVSNLVELARTLGAKVMHTSTCFVAGYRSGLIEENHPAEIPFPRAAGETWFGAACPKRTLDRSHWDPQREISECLDLVKQARQRCEDAFRQSAFLDEAKANLASRGEPCRGTALENELARVKRKFIKDRLVEAGKERALFWGWTNIYTYTKSIGEQVLASSGLPFTIVRPAVVETAVEFPFTGWNEGINTSAPYLYLASKGQVQFPGDHDVRLDIIPVDMVASGMVASLCELIEGRAPAVYQYGTTDTNGCRVTRYLELAGLYKRRQVFEGKKTAIFDIVSSRFEPRGLSRQQYNAHGARTIEGALRGLGGLLKTAGVGPAAALLKPAAAALEGAARAEQKTAALLEVFLPFVAEADWVFSCANTRAAMARMPPEERARFIWSPEALDWREWMWNVHLPGLEKWAFPLMENLLRREIKPLRPYDSLVDLLDEIAERHDHALALQQLEQDGLSRTSYRELRDAACKTAARLAALGVRRGDRVALSGANQPAWPVTYFGILRAGAVAVPIDPGLDAKAFADIVRSSTAKVVLWDRGVEAKLGAAVRAAQPNVAAFDLAGFAEGRAADLGPASGEGLAPPDVRVGSEDVASVVYTSGTTGEPKGVLLTHGNFTALLASLAPVFPLKASDRVLSVLPLHHTFEVTCGLLLPLSQGARIIYLDEPSADRLSEALKKARVTAMVGVPALWQMLERRIVSRVKEQGPAAATAFNWAMELNRMLGKRLGLNAGRLFFGSVHDALGGNVRFLISGGAALPRNTASLFRGLGLPLTEGYGLTEAAPLLTLAKASPSGAPGNVGKPIPGVQIKIASPDANGVGEVLARGPNVMKGYADDPRATEQALDAEGWLHTGDLGKLDKQGRLVLVGRQQEVITPAKGEPVYPVDVERQLGKVQHVRELAIVGVDVGRGEQVACLAVPEAPPAPRDGDEALARAAQHERALDALRTAIQALPKPGQPTIVHLHDTDLPRAASGQVKRSEVKAIVARLAAEATSVEGAGAAALAHDAATAEPKKHKPGEEPIQIPRPVADFAKHWMNKVQSGFYGNVMRPKVYGRAFIPYNRHTIVVSNHASHLDMGLVKYALGSYGDGIVSLAAQDYFFEGNRWRRAYFENLTNLAPFDRKGGLRTALRQTGEILDRGRTVLLFPEGTRSPDGSILEFKPAIGHLALTHGVDILPLYLGGTFEALPKGRSIPIRRDVVARIGPPLEIADLRRLTAGMKYAVACRKVAELTQLAVTRLREGGALDLRRLESIEQAAGTKEHPLTVLFRELETKYVAGRVTQPITYYVTLGTEEEAKWTLRIDPAGCEARLGKPSQQADCVLKTTPEIFTKIVREAYTPSPMEFMTGLVKSNDISLLQTFQKVFDLA